VFFALVQDSTVLWECFSTAAMEAALALHHTMIRQLLVKHGGYESATEGDSFILAFHSAKDAVLFSMELQQALLAAAWPAELLSHPTCQPLLVKDLG
jgi:class 3 adenylate cyclase